jgi:hypothetical protein
MSASAQSKCLAFLFAAAVVVSAMAKPFISEPERIGHNTIVPVYKYCPAQWIYTGCFVIMFSTFPAFFSCLTFNKRP